MLPNFACARAIGNLSRVCSGVNILRRVANSKDVLYHFLVYLSRGIFLQY